MPDQPLFEEMYRRMLRIRHFEDRAIELHRAGLVLGPVHTSVGQEATVVGACLAVREDDYMTGTHRSHGHPIGKGSSTARLMAELLGRVDGVCKGKGGSMHLADFSVGSLGESGIVASAIPVATGAGLSAQMRGTDQVALCFFGDAGANAGPFHEALNLAALWKLPVIFLCENNGFGVTAPQKQTTSVDDIAVRAAGYGMPGVVVDGQDVRAVHAAVSEAAATARAGEGPTLVEAKTLRLREHAEFGALKLDALRTEAEMAELWKRDPIALFRAELVHEEVLTEARADEIDAEVRAEIDAAVAFAEASPRPAAHALFEDLFADSLESTR